ncbi:MAG TPA: response regulator [Chthoniobacterales bacterium]
MTERPAAPISVETQMPTQAPKRTILVVDDNATNLKLVSDILGFEGYDILKAEDAETALAIVQQSPPDLILMDIALPGMDGLTLTRMLKAAVATRHILIAALTAFAMKGDDAMAFAAGCDGYITKPVNTRKLPGQITELLNKSQTPGALRERTH